MSGDNLTWMTYMRQLIAEYRLNHTFWCFNANSGDTGGLVLDDFVTWDEDKYEFVREVLWQDADGNFIGLDHVIALGDNGICLSDFSGLEAVPVLNDTAAGSSEAVAASGETVVADASVPAASPEAGTESGLAKGVKVFFCVLGGVLVVLGGVLAYVLGKKSVKKEI